jgi:hypothetical protein
MSDISAVNSRVILWRDVVNDAVVGPWKKLLDVREHTDAGLREWMCNCREQLGSVWDPSLITPGGYDPHLRNYGLRLQFWVPDSEQDVDVVVVCDNSFGVSLTHGKEYCGRVSEDGLYEVEDDAGERRAFFKERFHRIKQMCTM